MHLFSLCFSLSAIDFFMWRLMVILVFWIDFIILGIVEIFWCIEYLVFWYKLVRFLILVAILLSLTWILLRITSLAVNLMFILLVPWGHGFLFELTILNMILGGALHFGIFDHWLMSLNFLRMLLWFGLCHLIEGVWRHLIIFEVIFVILTFYLDQVTWWRSSNQFTMAWIFVILKLVSINITICSFLLLQVLVVGFLVWFAPIIARVFSRLVVVLIVTIAAVLLVGIDRHSTWVALVLVHDTRLLFYHPLVHWMGDLPTSCAVLVFLQIWVWAYMMMDSFLPDVHRSVHVGAHSIAEDILWLGFDASIISLKLGVVSLAVLVLLSFDHFWLVWFNLSRV